MVLQELTSFFLNLGIKFRKENDLSDVTWALCESCNEFKLLFLSFFWKEISHKSNVINFKREHSEDNKRPDFYFELDNRKYFIEVKIYDQKHHFNDFLQQFPNYKFGYITNYSLDNFQIDFKDKFEIRTWEEFENYLKNSILTISLNANAIAIIESYCEYIKSVCSIIKFKKMKLDNLSSLYFFNMLVEKIIDKPIDNLDCSSFKPSKGFNKDKSGTVIMIYKKETKGNEIYPWFGIYYGDAPGKTTIGIDFEINSCKSVFQGERHNPHSGKYYDMTNEDEKSIWFGLKQEHFIAFNNEPSFEKQEKLLTDFYIEVIGAIKKYL